MKKRDYFFAILNILLNACYIPLMYLNVFFKTRGTNVTDVVPSFRKVRITDSIYNVFKVIQAEYTINVAIIIFSISITIGIITLWLKTKEIAKLNFKFLIVTFIIFLLVLGVFIYQFYILH